MVTRLNLGLLFGLTLVACGGATVSNGPSPSGTGTTPTPSATTKPTDIPPGGAHYEGKGFIVHEWGTNTIVTGTDGSLQRGLHHEEEDLPGFVTDRVKATKLGAPVDVKMETPVTYFYSPTPLSVSVNVQFPKGILTQWYPQVRSFYPLLGHSGDNQGITTQYGTAKDPVLDPSFVFNSPVCAQKYGQAQNGLLDWGTVEIGERGVAPKNLAVAPLDKFTWEFARQVDSNPLTVTTTGTTGSTSEEEKFLFYRGLGNNPLPVTVTASNDKNGYDGGMNLAYNIGAKSPVNLGAVFVLRVGAQSGAFKVHPDGIRPGESLTDTAPSLDGAMNLDAFSDALAKSVVSELDKTGLYHDEAVAMVHTWQRQWFRTPGVRVLYLLPQVFTDEQIPLTITPAPEKMTRVMMIRVEVLTRAIEDEDLKFAACLESQGLGGSCEQHFISLGRFAEPRLRRAIVTSGGNKGTAALLAKVIGPNVVATTGE